MSVQPPAPGRRPLSARSKLVASVAVLGLLTAAVSAVVESAFTSTVRNPGNTFRAGTIALSSGQPTGSALFDLTGMKPGAVTSRCIRLTYSSSGGLASAVRLHGKTDGALAPHLKVRVSRGSFPTGSIPTGGSCTGFNAERTLFDDALPVFPDDHAGGIVDSDPSWTDGEAAVYRIDVELADTDAAQGGSATQEFVFEARSA